MESIFNINIDKNNIKAWNIDFEEKTDSISVKLDKALNYRRFISNTSYTYNKDNIRFEYYFVIEYFIKDNISYYSLSIVPDKYSLFKDRVDEVIQAFGLDCIDDLNENICFDYGYGVTIGQISFINKEFEPEIMNEISYASSIIKDIIYFYLKNEDNQYGTTKLQLMNFLCNDKNFI